MRVRLLTVSLFIAMLAFATPAFGAGVPVAPGNAGADQFQPSTACMCHGDLQKQFQASMHAHAITDPVFLTKVAEAEADAGPEVAAFCKRCHSPIGNMTKDTNATASEAAKEGVTCMFCHQVSDLKGAPRNVAHLLIPDLTRRAQIKDPAAPHQAVYSDLHTKAEFCGACHNVDHPSTGTHLETTYAEWLESPSAKAGVVCQDCHMSADPGGVVGPSDGQACATGAQRNNIYAMSFVGGNVGQGSAEAATKLLKSAATLELAAPEIVAPGETASVTVTITNKGAGHSLPTGLTEVREMWLSVVAEMADGTKVSVGERRFGTVLKDAKGNFPAEMWAATGVQSDDRIPAGTSTTSEYAFTMPAGATASKIVAVLNYRSVPQELADAAGVDNPTTAMAEISKAVYGSQAAKDAAEKVSQPNVGVPAGSNDNTALIIGAIAVVLLLGAGAAVWMIRSRKS